MSFAAYLTFQGTARAAMTFYAGVFGATDLQIMSFADAPPEQQPPGAADLVMHSQFSVGPGAPLMADDLMPGMQPEGIPGKVFYGTTDAAQARAVFDRLAEGGEVILPFGPTFWSPGFGSLHDQFGTHWMISVAGQQ